MTNSSLTLDEIDISRDILDIKFLLKSDQDPESIKYDLQFIDWRQDHFHLKIDFEDPSLIS